MLLFGCVVVFIVVRLHGRMLCEHAAKKETWKWIEKLRIWEKEKDKPGTCAMDGAKLL